MSKLFIFAFLLYALPFTLYPSPAHAQTTPLPSTISPTSPVYTDLIVNNMFHTFSCLSIGSSVIGAPCLTYQSGIPVLSQVNLSGGALGATTSLIGALYANPPLRTVDYLASVGESLGLVKEANAQVIGSGNQVLSPILKLWEVSRNISYVVMIIIFVIIGLMVMFRNRINPQTVITAQAALPGLVIGLILITFSYFLAALITDTAFIGTNLVGYYFSQVPGISPEGRSLTERASSENATSIFSTLIDKLEKQDFLSAADAVVDKLSPSSSPFDLLSPINIVKLGATFINQQFAQLAGPAAAGVGGAICSAVIGIPALLGAIGGGAAGGPAGAATGVAAGSTIGAMTRIGACTTVSNTLGDLGGTTSAAIIANTSAGGSIGTALFIIAVIFLLVAMIKLVIRLIQAYISIIFSTITAPFTFLAAALPGRQNLTTNWILGMLSNILAFPAVLAVFYFVAYLLGTDINRTFGITQAGAITNQQTLPLFGGMSSSIIKTLVGFVALIATPAVPDIIARSIGRISVAGELIGKTYAEVSGQGQGYIRQAQSGAGNISSAYGRIGPTFGEQVTYGPKGEVTLRTPSPFAKMGKIGPGVPKTEEIRKA